MSIANVYKALADPTRRQILALLRRKSLTAGELAAHFSLTKPTLSRHFQVLREADLIWGEKRANTITYHLNATVLEEALALLLDVLGVQPKLQDPANHDDSTEHNAAAEDRRPPSADD